MSIVGPILKLRNVKGRKNKSEKTAVRYAIDQTSDTDLDVFALCKRGWHEQRRSVTKTGPEFGDVGQEQAGDFCKVRALPRGDVCANGECIWRCDETEHVKTHREFCVDSLDRWRGDKLRFACFGAKCVHHVVSEWLVAVTLDVNKELPAMILDVVNFDVLRDKNVTQEVPKLLAFARLDEQLCLESSTVQT